MLYSEIIATEQMYRKRKGAKEKEHTPTESFTSNVHNLECKTGEVIGTVSDTSQAYREILEKKIKKAMVIL